MSWGEWLVIWAGAFALTGLIVGLAALIGFWTFLVIFPPMFLWGGMVVTR